LTPFARLQINISDINVAQHALTIHNERVSSIYLF
jgi:hypothetical protein